MEVNHKKVFKTLNLNKVWLPFALGIGAVFFLFSTDQDIEFSQLALIKESNWWLVALSLVIVGLRDFGYMYRLRTLTHTELSWKACFYIILLWEFSSAVTPSVVGGTLVAVFLLLKEGLPFGRSLAYVLVTAIFDNLFFILTAPLGLWQVKTSVPEQIATLTASWQTSLYWVFWVSYGLVVLYTACMWVALFFKPVFFQWALGKITQIKIFHRWHDAAVQHGSNMILASISLKKEKTTYWLKIALVTLWVWCARYSVLNILIAAYIPVSWTEHLTIFGKHIIMWVTMLVSPTPGSSGTAEFFFKQLYGGVLGKYLLITAINWRVLTYYLYLVMGLAVLSKWLKRVLSHP